MASQARGWGRARLVFRFVNAVLLVFMVSERFCDAKTQRADRDLLVSIKDQILDPLLDYNPHNVRRFPIH
jgi:hypothetical protein